REDVPVVREEPDDDEVLVAERLVEVVQRLDVRMLLREEPIRVRLDVELPRPRREEERDQDEREDDEPAKANHHARRRGEKLRNHGTFHPSAGAGSRPIANPIGFVRKASTGPQAQSAWRRPSGSPTRRGRQAVWRSATSAVGSVTRKVVPSPTPLSTWISPPCSTIIWCTSASPRPVPCSFVVKKGLKMLSS